MSDKDTILLCPASVYTIAAEGEPVTLRVPGGTIELRRRDGHIELEWFPVADTGRHTREYTAEEVAAHTDEHGIFKPPLPSDRGDEA